MEALSCAMGEDAFEKERCRAERLARALRLRREEGLQGLRLGVGGTSEGEVAGLPCIDAGLAANVGEGLLPDEAGEGFGDAGLIDEGVCDVDEELEAEGEAVAHETGGDEDASLAVAELDVTVTDGGVGELVGVGAGDHGGLGYFGLGVGSGVEAGVTVFGGLVQSEWDEVVGVGVEGGGDGGGDGLEHAVEIEVGDAGLAVGGEANAIGGLPDRGIVRHFDGAHKIRGGLRQAGLQILCHCLILNEYGYSKRC